MVFVLTFYIVQYLYCFVGGGGFYKHLLESTFQSSVFFDILTIFVDGGGTYTLYFATSQGRFKHI